MSTIESIVPFENSREISHFIPEKMLNLYIQLVKDVEKNYELEEERIIFRLNCYDLINVNFLLLLVNISGAAKKTSSKHITTQH